MKEKLKVVGISKSLWLKVNKTSFLRKELGEDNDKVKDVVEEILTAYYDKKEDVEKEKVEKNKK